MRRGFQPDDRVRRFLRPSFDDLHDPCGLTGLAEAADRIERAVLERETIFVHGDYDVDGMTGAAVLTLAIQDLGGNAVPFVPHRRRDGYDLSEAGIDAAATAGACLIVTADCGITAVEAVSEAAERGIDVIVTDHHRPGPELPPATAIVNPSLPGQEYPFRGLAGVGVAFKVVQELYARKGVNGDYINRYLDLVALGTIADQAPLAGENRALARFGLHVLNRSRRPGLRALCRAARVGRWSDVTATDVAYRLAPRLNSVGRIADAMDGLRLLTTQDRAEGDSLARRIDGLNVERQNIDRLLLDEIRGRIEVEFVPRRDAGIVMWGEGWHPGVLGIVASRLAEERYRPVLLITLDGDVGRGSARSIPDFHLFRALEECRDLFERFGGHAAAAGFDIRRDRLEALKTRFNQVAAARLGPEPRAPALAVDGVLRIRDVTPAVSRGFRHLAPFGNENPVPRFLAPRVRLRDVEAVGKDGAHARLNLDDSGSVLEAIAFRQPDLAARLDDRPRDVVYELHVETGRRGLRTQAHVVAIGDAL